MCSNTISGSYGDPNDYSGGVCLKKQKKEKVPRRGPGVAELEKILREQENNYTAISDSSLPPFFSQSYSSSPRNLMDQNIFCPPPPHQPVYNCSNNSFRPPATTNGGSCSLPEKAPIFPMIFVPSRPNSADVTDSKSMSDFSFSSYFSKDLMIPPAPVFQRKQHSLNHVQTMNLPQNVSMPPLMNPPSVGLFQFIEPPSNQRSSPNYASQLLEEDAIVGAKRPRNFLLDSSVNSQMNTKCNIGQAPAKPTSREAKQICSLDLRLKSSIPDYGTSSGNPITVDSPSPGTPPTPMPIQTCPRDFSNSKIIPLTLLCEPQEKIEEREQRRAGTDVSDNRKLFYSLLTSDEQSGDKEQTFGLKNEKNGANLDHGIDLRLKL